MGKSSGVIKMIVLFSGTPGSGKSLKATQEICMWLKQGKMVIANYPLKFSQKEQQKGWADRFYWWPNEKITINNLLNFAIETGMIERREESQCLVVIDEAGGRFNARNFQDKSRAEWIDFFSQHRKVGFSFVLIAQNDRMIDRQIRAMIETEFKHRKLNRFGIFGFLPFNLFMQVEYWYSIKARVGSLMFLYKKKWGEKYDHMAMFEGFRLSKELLDKIQAVKNAGNASNPEDYNTPVDLVLRNKKIENE